MFTFFLAIYIWQVFQLSWTQVRGVCMRVCMCKCVCVVCVCMHVCLTWWTVYKEQQDNILHLPFFLQTHKCSEIPYPQHWYSFTHGRTNDVLIDRQMDKRTEFAKPYLLNGHVIQPSIITEVQHLFYLNLSPWTGSPQSVKTCYEQGACTVAFSPENLGFLQTIKLIK